MRIALFSWETLHSIAVGGVGVHVTELAAALQRRNHEVHIFTRKGHNQSHYDCIHGVHYHRCPFDLHPCFTDEINNMCRSFVKHFFDVENGIGHFDIIHAHDWLASNAIVWIKEGRGHKAVLTMHSTEYGRNGNRFFGGQSIRVQDHERHGTYCADRVITVSNQLKEEIKWLYNLPDHKTKMVYNGVNASALTTPSTGGPSSGNTPSASSTPLFCSSAGWWSRKVRTSSSAPCLRCCATTRTPSLCSWATAT